MTCDEDSKLTNENNLQAKERSYKVVVCWDETMCNVM
jgi:hypothetical protein